MRFSHLPSFIVMSVFCVAISSLPTSIRAEEANAPVPKQRPVPPQELSYPIPNTDMGVTPKPDGSAIIYDSIGNHLHVQPNSFTFIGDGTSVYVDSDGNVYVYGFFAPDVYVIPRIDAPNRYPYWLNYSVAPNPLLLFP